VSIMRAKVNESIIELLEGDITGQDTDAIVNAANNTLLGGGGVDGAIHRAAGPQLLAETRAMGGCKTGDAKMSGGYRLKAKHVIHTVGPVYRRGDAQIAALLASAYRRSLEIAAAKGLRSIAFPSISTGAYGYPLEEAAPIAVQTVCDFLQQTKQISLVRFMLFGEAAYNAYTNALAALARQDRGIQLLER
jgi:O-acetyl-ADP-ribose deacetylase